jgi:hypothetical protein
MGKIAAGVRTEDEQTDRLILKSSMTMKTPRRVSSARCLFLIMPTSTPRKRSRRTIHQAPVAGVSTQPSHWQLSQLQLSQSTDSSKQQLQSASHWPQTQAAAMAEVNESFAATCLPAADWQDEPAQQLIFAVAVAVSQPSHSHVLHEQSSQLTSPLTQQSQPASH